MPVKLSELAGGVDGVGGVGGVGEVNCGWYGCWNW